MKRATTIQTIQQKEGNSICADCKDSESVFVSTNLGVFLCPQCAMIHETLGSHISNIKPCDACICSAETLALLDQLGNLQANRFWEANLDASFHRPKRVENNELATFIYQKYVIHSFIPSPDQENCIDHQLFSAIIEKQASCPENKTTSFKPCHERMQDTRIQEDKREIAM